MVSNSARVIKTPRLQQHKGCCIVASEATPPNGFSNTSYLGQTPQNALPEPTTAITPLRLTQSSPRSPKGSKGMSRGEVKKVKGAIEVFKDILESNRRLTLVFLTYTFPSKFKDGIRLTPEQYRLLFNLVAEISKDLFQEFTREIERYNKSHNIPCLKLPDNYLEVKEPQVKRMDKGYCCMHFHIVIFNEFLKPLGRYVLDKRLLMNLWRKVLNRYARRLFDKELMFEEPCMDVDKITSVKGIRKYITKFAKLVSYLCKTATNLKGKGKDKPKDNPKPKVNPIERMRELKCIPNFAWVTCDKETLNKLQEYVREHTFYLGIGNLITLNNDLAACPYIESDLKYVDGLDYPVALCIYSKSLEGEELWQQVMLWLSELIG